MYFLDSVNVPHLSFYFGGDICLQLKNGQDASGTHQCISAAAEDQRLASVFFPFKKPFRWADSTVINSGLKSISDIHCVIMWPFDIRKWQFATSTPPPPGLSTASV
jgi:hypothetical protein